MFQSSLARASRTRRVGRSPGVREGSWGAPAQGTVPYHLGWARRIVCPAQTEPPLLSKGSEIQRCPRGPGPPVNPWKLMGSHRCIYRFPLKQINKKVLFK